MIEKILWISGSCIYILLAGMHLLYTFFTNKFSVRDSDTEEKMKKAFPVLTKQTTMWKAWIGFNGSHSIGGIFFGLVNLIFAINYFELLRHSIGLILLTCGVSFFYLFLGFTYWFSLPRNGILVSTICFSAAAIIILAK